MRTANICGRRGYNLCQLHTFNECSTQYHIRNFSVLHLLLFCFTQQFILILNECPELLKSASQYWTTALVTNLLCVHAWSDIHSQETVNTFLTLRFLIGVCYMLIWQVAGMHSDVATLRKCSIWHEASRIFREEGIEAFWKGNLVTIVHRLPYSAISFYSYERYKNVRTKVLCFSF
jgi:hypothetical protein